MGLKGIAFTLDILIGLGIMMTLLLLLPVRIETNYPQISFQMLSYQSNDIINVLATLKASSFSSTPTISNLLANNIITEEDLNKTALDIIGSFWYSGNESIATNITRDILGNLTNECYSLYTDGESMYSSCEQNASVAVVAYKLASGYELGKPVSGFVARAFLNSIRSKTTSSYLFFGGYTGEGNISANINLPSFEHVQEVYMEMDAGTNFSLYINGNFAGTFVKGSAGGGFARADKWLVCNGTFNQPYCALLSQGDNRIQFNFSSDRAYIGGGYFRATYNTTEMAVEGTSGRIRHTLPGIYGVINLYDSFDIPGDLSAMEVFLNFSTNTPIFLEIGNATVYEGNVSVKLEDPTLSLLLDYNFLDQKTVPFRIGHYILNATNNTGYVTDVILTTSRVDAMAAVDIPNGTTNISRISAAKDLDKLFTNIILNNTGNREGLVSYKSTVPAGTGCNGWVEPLTTNKSLLECQISNYDAKPGNRCLCCAIHEAQNLLTNPLRKRVIVLMSDGSAESTTPSQCPSNYTGDPIKDSINEACHAYQAHNIVVHTIGFGGDANNTLLQQIAECGGGMWLASTNYTGLKNIYEYFATDIAEKSIVYEYQKIIPKNVSSILHPGSYFDFNFTPVIIPYEYGEISLTRETARFKEFTGDDIDLPDKEGWFNVSEKIKVVDAKAISYSSDFWTDRLYIKNATSDWNRVFWLGDFSSNYQNLGDPYVVQIPVYYIGNGNNSVRIGTGFAPENATGGSPDDRIIYEVRLKGSVGYGDVFNNSELAIEDANQRLIDEVSEYVDVYSENVAIDEKSVGGIKWLWGPSLFKIVMWKK